MAHKLVPFSSNGGVTVPAITAGATARSMTRRPALHSVLFFVLGGLLTAAVMSVAQGGCWIGCPPSYIVPPPSMLSGWNQLGIKAPLAERSSTAAASRLRGAAPPWQPILPPHALRRGLAFYGSGRRIEQLAATLLAGQPIKAFTIGGSVTQGAGASSESTNYPALLFRFINTTFPHRDHVFGNKGIGGTTSGIFSLCAEALIPQDASLVVVEFTFNEPGDQPFTSPQRRSFERLLRKLARLPGRPAVILLHHYAWWFCPGDGLDAGLYYRAAEAQFTTLAEYYDMPSPSVRTAVWPFMHAGVAPFKVSHVRKPNQTTPAGIKLPVAKPGSEAQYFYYDKVHPSDVGHQVMAELLAGTLMQAVQNVLSGSSREAALAARQLPPGAAATGSSGGRSPQDDGILDKSGSSSREGSSTEGAGSSNGSGDGGQEAAPGVTEVDAPSVDEPELPPPMIPGNADVPTTVCAMQEKFKELGVAMQGFEYHPERPNASSFVEQKWGYSAQSVGDWIELELSTADTSQQQDGSAPAGNSSASLYLGFLRSYQGMGLARVECVSGCTCQQSSIDGAWQQRVSLTHVQEFKVSQHPQCRVRVTLIERPSDDSSGEGSSGSNGGGNSGGGGSKFQLNSAMVSHFPIVLDNRIASAAGGLADHG